MMRVKNLIITTTTDYCYFVDFEEYNNMLQYYLIF